MKNYNNTHEIIIKNKHSNLQKERKKTQNSEEKK